ncbi:MAG: hypothetical protein CMI86_03170 [Candidatus Pelagibacter sp.]|nr:hypothetical protein [Candidatus Pelagibacter sp.]
MSKLKKILPYSIIFLPLLSVYTISIFYPIDNSVGKEVSFRPPGYVFAIVWPFLLIFLGISWFKRINSNIKINLIYIGLVILLSIWGILYNINFMIIFFCS